MVDSGEVKLVCDIKFDEGSDLELYGFPDNDYGRFESLEPYNEVVRNPNELGSDDELINDCYDGVPNPGV